MADTPSPATAPTPAVSWTAHEFEHKEKHPDWLWTVGLVFALGAAVAFFYGSIFFGIFLVIAGAVTIIYALQKPKLLSVAIEEKGVSINGDLTPFEKITQFWLDETDKPDKLLLRVKGSFIPVLTLPLEGVAPETVRATLKPRVPEELMRESNSVKLFDRIGF